MTIKELVSEICKREKGKSNVKVGDVREIISIISDMCFEADGYHVEELLFNNGKRRALRKKKK